MVQVREQRQDEMAGSAFAEIRRLWKSMGGQTLLPTANKTEELRAYYNVTLANLLCELEDLEEACAYGPADNFVQKFTTVNALMFRQLRLLVDAGKILLPLDKNY